MATKDKEFELHVSGDEIPDESVLLKRLQEALNRGTKKVNIVNGYVVDTDSSINIQVGPILGEVTTDSAIAMIEVRGKEDTIPISAKVYKEKEKGTPIKTITIELQANRPTIFQFEDLEPSTDYTGEFRVIF